MADGRQLWRRKYLGRRSEVISGMNYSGRVPPLTRGERALGSRRHQRRFAPNPCSANCAGFRPDGNDHSREGLGRAPAIALSSASARLFRVRRFAQLWLPPDTRTALLRPRWHGTAQSLTRNAHGKAAPRASFPPPSLGGFAPRARKGTQASQGRPRPAAQSRRSTGVPSLARPSACDPRKDSGLSLRAKGRCPSRAQG
jgi:hypothetical protein